jgi:small-conductance mechanosensitive channel
MDFMNWPVLDVVVFGNTVRSWIGAMVVALVVFCALWLIRSRVAARLSALAKSTHNRLDDLVADMVQQTKLAVILMVTVWASTQALELPDGVTSLIRGAAVIVLLFQAALWGNRLVKYVVERYVHLEEEDEAARVASTAALTFLGKLVLWSVVVLMALQNLGFEITPLLASLGVGGIAVALAAQNILSDLFASLSIMLDQPFAVGDFIVVDDLPGTVEHVGLKTTRVRSLQGEQLVFANADLLGSRIRNFKRMQERRVVFTVGVTYETPFETLSRIPEMLREIVSRNERVRFDRAHFKSYGDSSLDFEIVYWVEIPDYNTYMDIQQSINLEIFQRFEGEGIEFAYPTRTLHVVPSTTGATPST